MSDHQHTFSRDRLVQKFGEQPFSLVFSGQGFNWLKTLREAVAAGAGFNVNSIVERAASLTEPVADELTAPAPSVLTQWIGRQTTTIRRSISRRLC